MMRINLYILLLFAACTSCQNGDSFKREINNSHVVDVCFDSNSIKLGQSYKYITKNLKGKYNKDDFLKKDDIKKTIYTFDTLFYSNEEIPYSLYFSFENDTLIKLTIYFTKCLMDYQKDKLKDYFINECNIKLEQDSIYHYEHHIVKVYLGRNTKGEESITVLYLLNW